MKHKLNYGHINSLSLFIITLLVSVFEVSSASALTYQSSTNVEFTLNPTISITLSDPNLIIDNLTPGSSNDSNIITVNISTNAGYGYYMSATAGTSTGNTDLTNQSSPSAKFTNLSSNVATLSSFPDNNWGYSYSTDNGTTWISGSEGNTSTGYNGLPLDNDDSGPTGIILSSTDSFTNTGSIKFKIGAKASTTQASGTYTNTVNFYAVANPAPAAPAPTPPTSCPTPVPGLTYMQDLTSSNKATILSNMTEDSEYYLADKRDDKTYCVAKLRDGNLWMTQNLDHDIKTDGSVIYDNTTTDLGWNGTSHSAAFWTPSAATYDTSTTTWNDSYTTPESYDPGNLYWNGRLWPENQSDCEAAGGSWESTGDSDYCSNPTLTSSTGNSHYHLGNYYNWTAAIAMNDSGGYTTLYADANQSVCPAGWTLPKSGNNVSSGSFEYLFTQYGWNSNSYMMENPNIWNTAIKLPLAGTWNGSLYNTGYDGSFWSSVIYGSGVAYSADVFYGGYVDPNHNGNGSHMGHGHPVRCLAR